MSEARFDEAKRSPWDAAVIVMALASLLIAIVGLSGLATLNRAAPVTASASQQCTVCKAYGAMGTAVFSRAPNGPRADPR